MKTMEYDLAIDIGSTNIKAALLDKNGILISHEKIKTKYIRNNLKVAEIDPETLYLDLMQLIYRVARGYLLSCMAISSQMAGLVLLDHTGSPVYPAIAGIDIRGETCKNTLYQEIPAQRIYYETGCPPQGIYPSTKLLWLRLHLPSIFHRAKYILGIKDYLIYRLLNKFITDEASASASQLFSIRQGEWWSEIQETLEIKNCVFPTISSLASRVGFIQFPWQKTKTTLLNGTGDGIISSIASGAVTKDCMCVSLGTTIVSRCITEEPETILSRSSFNFRLEGNVYLTGRRVSMAGQLISEYAKRSNNNEELIKQNYYWNGKLHNDGYLSDAQKLRALLEGILFELYCSEKKQKGIRRLCCIGGGSKNTHWVQSIADLFQLPVFVPESSELLFGMIALFDLYRKKTDSLLSWKPPYGFKQFEPMENIGLLQRFDQYMSHV